MNPIQIALELKRLIGNSRNFFMKLQPEVFDFTFPDFAGELVFFSATEELRLKVTAKELVPLLGLVQAAVLGEKDFSVIAWNIKNLVSFVKFHTKAAVDWEAKILDLKLLEGFLGIREAAPANMAEAMERAKRVMKDGNWNQAKLIWQKVHTPLVFDVIPSIETQGIYNSKERKALYSYYEIEGQVGGRLKCTQEYRHSFVPHTMGP